MIRRLPALLLVPASVLALEVEDAERVIVLRDEQLSAAVSKRDGKLHSLKYHERELIRGGQGYWSTTARAESERVGGFPPLASVRVTADPAENGGKLARVSVFCPPSERPGTLPVRATFHYALVDDGTGLYLYAELEHPPELGGFSMAEGRFVLKPDARVFDWIHIDGDRSRPAPSGSDWDRGETLNMKEVRRLTTGIHKGEVEHKYRYSALYSESPAFGWCSTRDQLGLWMIQPSLESHAGGPTKPELTAHLDVNRGGRPVLLNMWHGSHYGGTSLDVRQGESWSKIIGPFLLHANQGGSPQELASAALATAAAEARRWPYPWVESPLYAAAGRHAVSGRIALDPAPSRPGAMWVGLTPPDYPVEHPRGRSTVDWQRDGKFYQYWTRAAEDGSFALPHVRPGRYALRAFREGVAGEFAREEVEVAGDTELGSLRWTPDRAGPTIWQIGIPDRSAAEFRDGDRYWEWGNYYRYQTLFPKGVDFTVGEDDWADDWYYCQPPRIGEDDRVLGSSTWTVRFELDGEPADSVLRIALCGYRERGNLQVFVNGRILGDTGRFRENGVMHRDGIRGHLSTWTFPIAADRLVPGDNRIELVSSARDWPQGILYDFLRLERVQADPPRAEPSDNS